MMLRFNGLTVLRNRQIRVVSSGWQIAEIRFDSIGIRVDSNCERVYLKYALSRFTAPRRRCCESAIAPHLQFGLVKPLPSPSFDFTPHADRENI